MKTTRHTGGGRDRSMHLKGEDITKALTVETLLLTVGKKQPRFLLFCAREYGKVKNGPGMGGITCPPS